MSKAFPYVLSIFALLAFVPALAIAHEVYVLDPATIASSIASPSPNPLMAIFANLSQFFFWGFVCFVGFSTIFFMSIFHRFEERFAPLFARLKKYAAPTGRIALGLSLIACGYNAALFGPELPFSSLAPDGVLLLQAICYASGTLIALGLYTRLGALLLLPVLLLSLIVYGLYMPMYAAYFGELAFLAVLGGGLYAVSDGWSPRSIKRLAHRLEPYAFPILRIAFGISIVYAAVYAKFIHSNLALETIAQYNLVAVFPFDPLFTVLGAFIIESLIGIFFIIGLEIRWNAIFFLFWLTLSLLYFGEAVWPHLIIIGLNLAFIFHGYDRYSLEGRFFKKGALEPVL